MNRQAVTKAQLTRAVRALEAMGKTVTAAVLHPDGSWEVRLTDAANGNLSSPDQADTDWDRKLGLQ